MTKYALYNPATHAAVPRQPTQGILACEGEYNKEQVRRIYTVILKAAAAPPHVVELEGLRTGLTCEVYKAIGCDLPCEEIRGCTCAAEGAQAILKLLGVK